MAQVLDTRRIVATIVLAQCALVGCGSTQATQVSGPVRTLDFSAQAQCLSLDEQGMVDLAASTGCTWHVFDGSRTGLVACVPGREIENTDDHQQTEPIDEAHELPFAVLSDPMWIGAHRANGVGRFCPVNAPRRSSGGDFDGRTDLTDVQVRSESASGELVLEWCQEHISIFGRSRRSIARCELIHLTLETGRLVRANIHLGHEGHGTHGAPSCGSESAITNVCPSNSQLLLETRQSGGCSNEENAPPTGNVYRMAQDGSLTELDGHTLDCSPTRLSIGEEFVLNRAPAGLSFHGARTNCFETRRAQWEQFAQSRQCNHADVAQHVTVCRTPSAAQASTLATYVPMWWAVESSVGTITACEVNGNQTAPSLGPDPVARPVTPVEVRAIHAIGTQVLFEYCDDEASCRLSVWDLASGRVRRLADYRFTGAPLTAEVRTCVDGDAFYVQTIGAPDQPQHIIALASGLQRWPTSSDSPTPVETAPCTLEAIPHE